MTASTLTDHPHSDFLETLDESSFFSPPPSMIPSTSFTGTNLDQPRFPIGTSQLMDTSMQPLPSTSPTIPQPVRPPEILPAATKTERFLLTAADQESGSRNERLNRVIRSKYEAGLLKPYNYVKGYARLSRWMDRK